MSLDQFLDRRYDFDKYNCLHHTAEVWRHLTGDDILERLDGILDGIQRAHLSAFEWLTQPTSPCLVVMRHRGARGRNEFHVGVFLNRRIMHITEHGGVQYQPTDVVAHGFNDFRYCR